MKSLFIVCTVIAVTGCSLHRSNLKETPIELPASFSAGAEEAAASLPIGKWWENFGDQKLNAYMEEAFKNNPDIIRTFEKIRQQEALFKITDSSRGLVLNLEGTAGRSRKSGASGTTTSNAYSLSAVANYEIDLWKKLDSASRAARLDKLASVEDLRALYISISAELVELYYLAHEQTAQLDLSEQTIDSFRDTLERVERRYRAGLVPAIDLYQSRQNLFSAKAIKPLFESGLSVTLNAVSVLTGHFPSDQGNGFSGDLVEIPEFKAGLPSKLLVRRPDVKASLLRLKASDARVAAAIADRFPSFNLTGSYGGSSEKLRTVLDSPNIFWNILLQAAQPLLDAGRRKAEVQRTEALFRENLAAYHKTVLIAFKEVRDALAKSRASAERIHLIKERVSAGRSTLRIALDRYMQGLSDYLPVLDAQQRLYDARSSLLTAKHQLISDRVELARALGAEWMDEEIDELVSK